MKYTMNNENLHKEQSPREIQERIHRQEHGRRRKAAIRRQKARRRNVCIAIAMIVILLIVIMIKIGGCTSNNGKEKNSSVTNTETQRPKKQQEITTKEQESVKYDIKAPVKRSKSEVYKVLKKYAKKDTKMGQLYQNRKSYSKELLNKVVNNPEMIDFVLNYNTAENKVTGGLTAKEKKAKFPLLIQWDERWAYKSYGDSNIGLAGCGPTCLSMVIFSLTRNDKATPDAIAGYSQDNGYYVDGIGTSWQLMTAAAEAYDVTAYQISLSEETMKSELDSENMLICSVGPGDFTTEGHFIVIYGYDEEGFSVNDPYCKARSERKWDYDELSEQIRAVWTYIYE